MSVKNQRWEDGEINFLQENLHLTHKEIASKLGRTRESIRKKYRRLGLPNKRYDPNYAYQISQDFFKEWSSDMSYILGMIFADGHLRCSTQGYSFSISSKDRECLEKINKKMGSNYKITKRRKDTQSENKWLYVLTIYRKEIVEDVMHLGVRPNKSLTMTFPKIPDIYFWHFLRGYIDGDGLVKYKRGLTIEMYSGSREFLSELANKLKERGIATSFHERFRPDHNKHRVYRLYVLKDNKQQLVTNLVRDATLFMERKFNHLQNYLKNRSIVCTNCNQKTPRRGNTQIYCLECAKKQQRERSKINQRKYRMKLREST